ncbi:putative major capsid protein [Eel River basin pequenovirus]|nr:putative major capsid protein [Eel River basin pequenovirus]
MFQNIRSMRPKLNKFDLSHDVKLSFNMGDLIPILVNEVVPGDRFQVQSEVMLRFAPMLAPIMHRVNVWTHYFFVPNRLVWNEWEEFITGGEDGTAAPVHPHFTTAQMHVANKIGNGDLADYMGVPLVTGQFQSQQISALPFRAYSLIWNEWYRDQNLQTEIPVNLTSGNDLTLEQLDLQKRCWEKDYLTSCLPWPQRGEAVSVPGSVNYTTFSTIHDGVTGASRGDTQQAGTDHPWAPGTIYSTGGSAAGGDYVRLENIEDLEVDINDLRRSNALQRWLELAARGGSRYVEQVKAFFGVTSSDARLQRPEFLGGGRQNVMISEVLQTGETATTPQGNMAGHGIAVGATNRFKRRFEEHGFVLGIVSVLPKTAYQQGIHRMFSRADKFDYYFPQFAHLGEQEVLNREVQFAGSNGDSPEDVFGYQSRYAEYKHKACSVHGDFRDTLDYWHMGRIFNAGVPSNLNANFVASDPTHRIFANTTVEDHKLWAQIYHKFNALRPMPYYADPRL